MKISLLNQDEIWEKFEKYDTALTRSENKLIYQAFLIHCEGNNIELDVMSSPESESLFQTFKSAWIMSAIFS